MLPDYIIYDELKRERERGEREQDQRPQLEIPRYMPYWPQPEFESPARDDGDERGVEIIQT
jgi:hypothetical protein